jgi:hypothetical protein
VPYIAFREKSSTKLSVVKYNKTSNNWAYVGTPSFSENQATTFNITNSFGNIVVVFRDGNAAEVAADTLYATAIQLNLTTGAWEQLDKPKFSIKAKYVGSVVDREGQLYSIIFAHQQNAPSVYSLCEKPPPPLPSRASIVFPTEAAGTASTSVVVSGITFTLSIAWPFQYGNLAAAWNTPDGSGRTFDGTYSLSTNLYLGTNAWAGGMLTTTLSSGASYAGFWFQLSSSVVRKMPSFGWKVPGVDGPNACVLLGSSSGSDGSWTLLHTVSTQAAQTAYSTLSFTPSVLNVYFKHYRVVVLSVMGVAANPTFMQSTMILMYPNLLGES